MITQDLFPSALTDASKYVIPSAAFSEKEGADMVKHGPFTASIDVIDAELGGTNKEFYQSLSSIQKQINVPFVLFAGCSKLCEQHIPDNLDYILPCWTKLVDTTLLNSSYFDSWERALNFTDYLIDKFPQNATSLKNSFVKIDHALAERSAIWQTNENFGWVHAGAGGYYKMFDKLMQKIGEIDDSSKTSD